MKPIACYEPKIDPLRDTCPIRATLDVIHGRWKPSILCELRSGSKRFSELQATLGPITAQTLTVQLRQLEADEIVSRFIHQEIPARVEYSISAYGSTLVEILDKLESWGTNYLKRHNRLVKGK
jgi:DNA-binding HxlR family transcriptional regulator